MLLHIYQAEIKPFKIINNGKIKFAPIVARSVNGKMRIGFLYYVQHFS